MYILRYLALHYLFLPTPPPRIRAGVAAEMCVCTDAYIAAWVAEWEAGLNSSTDQKRRNLQRKNAEWLGHETDPLNYAPNATTFCGAQAR